MFVLTQAWVYESEGDLNLANPCESSEEWKSSEEIFQRNHGDECRNIPCYRFQSFEPPGSGSLAW